MSNWAEGYVSDVTYTQGYYRELSPMALSLALMLRGLQAPDLSQALNYCELGFGYGLSLLTHAACFPNIKFYGTDFNPAHAVHAREVALKAGLSNIEVFDDSFEQLAQRDQRAPDLRLHGAQRQRRLAGDLLVAEPAQEGQCDHDCQRAPEGHATHKRHGTVLAKRVAIRRGQPVWRIGFELLKCFNVALRRFAGHGPLFLFMVDDLVIWPRMARLQGGQR